MIVTTLLVVSSTLTPCAAAVEPGSSSDIPALRTESLPEVPIISETPTQGLPASDPADAQLTKSLDVVENTNSTTITNNSTPEPITTQPAPVYASDDVLVSAFQFHQGAGFDAVELHNTTTAFLPLNTIEVHLLYSSTATDYECIVTPSGYLQPLSYVTYAQGEDHSDGTYLTNGCPNPGGSLFDKEIQVFRGGILVESVRIAESDMSGSTTKQWERKGWTTTYRTGVLSQNFKQSTRGFLTSQLYVLPDQPTLEFLEVFPHPALCSAGDMHAECHRYVKLKNTGPETIDLTQFRLRSGDPKSRPSSYNTSDLSGQIGPGEYKVLITDASGGELAIDDEDGAIWLEDHNGLTTYPSTVTPYHDAELVKQQGRSWAYDAGDHTWKWVTPSPSTEKNDFSQPLAETTASIDSGLKPCAANQYRSSETNRCRLIVSTTSGLKPCKDGQYRSEETNRCRSIASAVSSLKPCADDQFRSPTTNRCKKIASTDDILKPCDDGYQRNPETNRCRKVATLANVDAAYPVQPATAATSSFVAWWAIVGVATLGIGYGGWEWRHEIGRGLGRAARVVRRK